jgi:hypothetical protein
MPDSFEIWIMGREPCCGKLCNLLQVPDCFVPFKEIFCQAHIKAPPIIIKKTMMVPHIIIVHNALSNLLSM